jgi:hypothetical protein
MLLRIYFQIIAIDNNDVFSYFVLRFLLQIWLNMSQIQRKYGQRNFDVFVTMHHSIDLFQLPTECTIPLIYNNICVTL